LDANAIFYVLETESLKGDASSGILYMLQLGCKLDLRDTLEYGVRVIKLAADDDECN
jgi:hypothetical protein